MNGKEPTEVFSDIFALFSHLCSFHMSSAVAAIHASPTNVFGRWFLVVFFRRGTA